MTMMMLTINGMEKLSKIVKKHYLKINNYFLTISKKSYQQINCIYTTK